MLFLLCLFACPSTPEATAAPFDVPLDPPVVAGVDYAPPEPAYALPAPTLLGTDGVIDLTKAPETMPPAGQPAPEKAPAPNGEAAGAVAVEVRSRD